MADQDTSVARGAGLYAAHMKGMLTDWSIDINDICPRPIGVEIAGGKMFRLIEKNAPLPYEGKQKFETTEDDMNQMTFNVYEGEDENVKNNYRMTDLEILGIPDGDAGTVEVELSFAMDINFQLTILSLIHI